MRTVSPVGTQMCGCRCRGEQRFVEATTTSANRGRFTHPYREKDGSRKGLLGRTGISARIEAE
jgi:hypothetical protein